MEEMESVLQCQDLWKDFLDVEAEEEVDQKTRTLMTGAIGARLLFDSVQRPGRGDARRVSAGEGVWVVRVQEHKTSAQGPAHLTLTADTKRYVDRFVETIRLVNDPFERSGNLVVLPGGNPVTNLNNLLDKVSRRYGIFIPTSTQLRQKTATMCALRGTDTQVRLVSKLMTHTHRRHYEQLGSASHGGKGTGQVQQATKESYRGQEGEVPV